MTIFLTDDQWQTIREKIDSLDNFSTGITAMTMLPDRIHVQALREALPSIVRELRAVESEVEIGLEEG